MWCVPHLCPALHPQPPARPPTPALIHSRTRLHTPTPRVDCDRASAGAYNSLERLDFERAFFFNTSYTMGQKKLRQEVQAEPLCPGFGGTSVRCVENRRWMYNGVMFMTANVQGAYRCWGATGKLRGVEGCPTGCSTTSVGRARVCWQAASALDVQWRRSDHDRRHAGCVLGYAACG